MNPIPVSKEYLAGLKDLTEEEYRLEKLNSFVKNIYVRALNKAKTSKVRLFEYELIHLPDLIKTNMWYIIDEIMTLFPDCSVKYIDNISRQYLTIDWS